MAGVLQYALSLKTSSFTGPLRSAGGSLKSFTSGAVTTVGVLGSVAVGLGAITAAAGVTALAFKSLKAAASFEQTAVSFRVLIGNAKEATVVLNKLRKFANSTPFEFKEVAAAGKKLLAMGSSTGQLTAELRALGDIAAGTSTPLEEISFLYGKMRSKGKLMAEELNQLMERGIPIVALLAKKYKVAESSILEMASKGKIGFSDMQEAVIKLTSEGGKFHGMMQEQSKTTLGLWSTLKSAVDELYITLGTPINDAIKPMLAGAIAQVQDLGARTGAFFKLLSEASQKGGFADVLGAGLVLAASKFINVIAGGIRGTVAYLGAALPKIFKVASDGLFSKNNLLIMEKTFLGIGNMLLKYLLKGAQALAEAVGAKGTAIKLRSKALGADMDSKRAFMSAQGKFAGEEGNPTAFDPGEVLSKSIKGMIDVNKAGMDAFKKASSKQLIDTNPLKSDFAKKAEGLNKDNLDTVLNGIKKTAEVVTKLTVDKPKKTKSKPSQNTKANAEGVAGAFQADVKDPTQLPPLTLAQRSAKNRRERRSAADGGIGAFKIHAYARKNKISFKEAKEKLYDATRAASPRRARRNADEKAARDAATKAATEGTLLKIAGKMETIAVA